MTIYFNILEDAYGKYLKKTANNFELNYVYFQECYDQVNNPDIDKFEELSIMLVGLAWQLFFLIF